MPDVRCDFCGATGESGLKFITGSSTAACERCVRAMFWRIQDESSAGEWWRRLGLNRSSAQVDIRIFLAMLPSICLIWVIGSRLMVDAPIWTVRIVLGLVAVVIVAFITVLLMAVVERAIAQGRIAAIGLWAAWFVCGWLIWLPAGAIAAVEGAIGGTVLVFVVLALARRMEGPG